MVLYSLILKQLVIGSSKINDQLQKIPCEQLKFFRIVTTLLINSGFQVSTFSKSFKLSGKFQYLPSRKISVGDFGFIHKKLFTIYLICICVSFYRSNRGFTSTVDNTLTHHESRHDSHTHIHS